jgi:cysteine desulfurase/selenocysteine lyase
MKRFGIPATSRVSLAFYNTEEELDTCVKAIEKAIQLFV